MSIFDEIDLLKPFLAKGAWDELEAYGFSRAKALAGDLQAKKIATINPAKYATQLTDGLKKTLKKAQNFKAIYFEYDLDNAWQSNFFLCKDYKKEVAGDDDWACDYDVTVDGPDNVMFAEIYSDNGFSGNDVAVGSTIYLVARTVATFGRAVDSALPSSGSSTSFLSKLFGKSTSKPNDIAICIAFHDQDPVMRIRESA